MSFRIKGLPAETFRHLFALSDEALRAQRALRRTVDEENAFPPRQPDRCGAGRGGAAGQLRASSG